MGRQVAITVCESGEIGCLCSSHISMRVCWLADGRGAPFFLPKLSNSIRYIKRVPVDGHSLIPKMPGLDPCYTKTRFCGGVDGNGFGSRLQVVNIS